MEVDNNLRKTKVGILTFLHTLNYGAVLQAYALQRVLQDAGFVAIQVDYRNDAVEAYEFKKAASLKGKLANIVRRPLIRKKERAFEGFRREYVVATRPMAREDLPTACEEFDFVIVGSDQVWNGEITGYDSAYFLDFIEDAGKKRTYAVSIGQEELPVCPAMDYAALMASFPHVLVRERTAARALAPFCSGTQPEVVADPTFLLGCKEWLKLANCQEVCNKKPYVFVYAVSETSKAVAFAKAIAKQRGLDVLVVQQNGFLPIRGVKNILAASPTMFLSCLSKAEVIVTSSFHGTCLSLQMEKEFFVSCAPGLDGRNSRMTDLLQELDLSDRILGGSGTPEEIDWQRVRNSISEMRSRSLSLLTGSLEVR